MASPADPFSSSHCSRAGRTGYLKPPGPASGFCLSFVSGFALKLRVTVLNRQQAD
jgi:hypothetical protein